MNSPMGAKALARALFGWIAGAKAETTAGFQVASSANEFPRWVEVIRGKLKVRIFLHDIKYEKEKIPCWSYLTDGLAAHKQKEILFTLRREKGQKPNDYPREFLELFATVFQYAEKGELVDQGGVTLFGEPGFLGHKNVRGIGYVEPQGFPGVETSGVPLLAAILLKEDEAKIASDLGLTRITALLGKKYRYYPCPTWSDLKREPVASQGAMDKTLLRQITRVSIRASYYEEQDHIFLSVSPSSRSRLQEFLGQRPFNEPLALYTQPDSRANACLVWHLSQYPPMAIAPPGSDGSRKTGAFLAFVPEQEKNEIRMLEDGFSVFLTNNDWQKIREALLSGKDVFVPPVAANAASISLEWKKAVAYTSLVTGETFVAEGWATYKPETTLPPKELVAVSSSRTVLLTNQPDLAARTTAEDLAAYVNAIEKVVDGFFTPLDRKTSRELTIHLALTPTGHEVRVVAVPELSEAVAEDLNKRLGSVPAPRVGGPVMLEFIPSVWKAASNQ